MDEFPLGLVMVELSYISRNRFSTNFKDFGD